VAYTSPRTDDTLSKEVSKYQAPEALLALSKATIEQYTDASKTTDGKVGMGCYIEAGETHTVVRLAQRITDRVTVYAGEMAAVQLALRTAIQMNENTPIVVFTDSLAVVRSVEAGHSASRPNLLRHLYDLIHQTNQDVTWCGFLPTSEYQEMRWPTDLLTRELQNHIQKLKSIWK